jgi:two-component system phosphate regulon sensor histidine kinase PhoR
MKSFELIPGAEKPAGLSAPQGLGAPVLIRNATWFIKVRWIVIGVFLAAGLAGRLVPAVFLIIGLSLPYRGMWLLAGGLTAANLFFYFFSRNFTTDSPPRRLKTSIWLQILVDLLAVTFLVHLIGSTDTFIAFTYLFHITLSCIFFPQKESLLVSFIAAVFYITTVVLELSGIWKSQGILTIAFFADQNSTSLKAVFCGSAVFVWFVEWYFVSSLSQSVRKRDLLLSTANDQLIKADQEKTKQVLLTTHDLKAPFAGIESNIQVLKSLHWDETPESVRAIIEKIDHRAQALRERIRDVLILGDLKSHDASQAPVVPVDIQEVVAAVMEELAEKAESRRISFDVRVPSIMIVGDREKLSILILNLIANAIYYSHEGGPVTIRAEQSGAELILSISDQGIGIKEEALPHIFEEYYRTKNAVQHNIYSTGLGLSIVREVARSCGLKIRVESEVGRGTTFEVFIPTGGG